MSKMVIEVNQEIIFKLLSIIQFVHILYYLRVLPCFFSVAFRFFNETDDINPLAHRRGQ